MLHDIWFSDRWTGVKPQCLFPLNEWIFPSWYIPGGHQDFTLISNHPPIKLKPPTTYASFKGAMVPPWDAFKSPKIFIGAGAGGSLAVPLIKSETRLQLQATWFLPNATVTFALFTHRRWSKHILCACFSMTGNGPRTDEFAVMLKQAHDIFECCSKPGRIQQILGNRSATGIGNLWGGREEAACV